MDILLWCGFCLFILALLALDLGVFNRNAHVVSTREALGWTALWVAIALAFGGAVYWLYEHHIFGVGLTVGHNLDGSDALLQYLTGYVVEKSLSLDNIFVIALIFGYFRVPLQHQHRVLFWGVIGALVLRGAMIAAGAALIHRFEWIIYVFGIFLIGTAIRLLISDSESVEPDKNFLVRLVKRFIPVTDHYVEGKLFTRVDGRLIATPMFIVLTMVESTDVLFAVDSIPAIFAITRDPLIVFTSNVFAILELRSLYFALAGVMDKFEYLRASLVFLLAFIGVKMILSHHVEIPMAASLGIIVGTLAVGILASVAKAYLKK